VGKGYQSLDDLLNDCTVRIKTEGGHGTGFFVAPGLIMTCAHVIEDALKKNTPITAYFNFNQKAFPVGQVGKEDIFAASYPDLVLLRVDIRDHPCVLLGLEYRAFTDFYSYGYTKDHPDGESTTVECEGTFEDGGTLIKLKEGQVKPGSSGSPLLNKKTGSVCGMIARTRDRTSDLGGAGIPIETIFVRFPALERQNPAFHRRDKLWKDLLEKEVVAKPRPPIAALLYDRPGKISKPKHWVGREELLVRVKESLDQSYRVLLTGMGGIGKTSLAQMLVEEHLQAGSKPILWLEVGDEKVDVLIEALAEKCGDDKIVSIPNTEAKKLALKELLEKYEAGLFVIDNVRDLSALDDLLEAIPEKLPVLMTSRISFETDDIVDVSQLPPGEGLELLAKTSGAKDYSTNESAKALCQLFGYHPLALEIAGGSMKERRGLTPAKLLERLKSNPIKLSSLRRGEIRPLLDDCVADLTEDLQVAFFAFGKFEGNRCTPTLLATYLGKSIEVVTDALEALVLRNLVKSPQDADVYYLHDLIFHYVQTVAGPDEQDKSHLIETGISYLEAHRRDLELIGFDLSNLLGIAEIGKGLDLVKLVSYLTIGNFPLPDGRGYADQRGYSIALIEQLDRTIEASEVLGEELNPTTHYLWSKRGNAAFWRGEYEFAAKLFTQALLLSPNEERKAVLESVLARTLAFCGRLEESNAHFEMASQLADNLNDDWLRGFVLEQESHAAGHLKDYARALRVAQQQLVLAESLFERTGSEDYEPLAFALVNFASAKLDLAKEGRGDVDGVLAAYERMKSLAEKHGDEHLRAYAYKSLGEYYHYAGDKVQAQSNLSQALEVWHRLVTIQEEKDLIKLMQELGYTVSNSMEEQNEHKI
jgi:tetratricopeptide (TPR) repeat protein